MKIINVAENFVKNYEPTISYLERFFEENQEDYAYYFLNHCLNKEEKMTNALVKHPAKLADIHKMSATMPALIQEITQMYETLYGISFTQDVHLIVGIYGSNAYTHLQFNPEVTFCLEKLSAEPDHLRVIIAHEFGHATQNLLSMKVGIDWSVVNWNSPYTWLLQEGCATYFSTKVVDVSPDIYFAYERDVKWLAFCEENERVIIKKLMDDLEIRSTREIFKEWFSINGGTTFGQTRLGYYIGYRLVTTSIVKNGELETITSWKEPNFEERLQEALLQLCNEAK